MTNKSLETTATQSPEELIRYALSRGRWNREGLEALDQLLSDKPPVNLEGSFVIERYKYLRASGTKGTQWCVHQERNGEWHQLVVKDTLREATAWLARHRQ